ncbi:MAG: hypothetical protein P8181_11010 [bacterium]
MTSYCTRGEKQTEIMELSPDETYLVDAYVKVREATELSYVSPSKSDSLFAVLDSTLDTLRISNTIRELNHHPDRWVLVFRRIEEKTQGSDEPVGPEDPASE